MTQQKSGDLQDRDENGRFPPGQSGNPQGRPKGSRNTATKVREELLGPILPEAIDKLRQAVSVGERWAIEEVLRYCLPRPKPVDPEEIEEFELRLADLERVAQQH